ncbi:MAG: acyltransferase [Promethearchaeota archaeon]
MSKPSVESDFIPILSANYAGKKWCQFLVILEFSLTIFVMFYIDLPYYRDFLFTGNRWKLLLLPISLYGLIWQFFGITVVFSIILYKTLAWIFPPKEGIFDINGPEFHQYIIRFWISYYFLFVARAMPLPWVDMYVFPIFGSKIGKNVVLYDSWVDPEFVEINDSCMISLNTQIISHCVYQDKFIVKKVILERSSIAGAESIVAPGTIIEEGAVLGGRSRTKIDQRLQGFAIHVGNPVNKMIPIKLKTPESHSEKASENQTNTKNEPKTEFQSKKVTK